MFGAHGHVMLTINEPMDQVVTPLNCVSVKIFARTLDRDIHTCLLIERPLEPMVCGQKNTLARSTSVNHLHDVELAAARPSSIWGISRQHPNG